MKNGFTLIELLVVILIIGILAGVALPKYQMSKEKAKFALLKQQAHAIQQSMFRYHQDNSTWATTLDVLDVQLKGTLSGNKTLVYLADNAQCYIGGDCIFCNRTIFGITVEYSAAYKTSRKRACVAFSQTNDRANQFCQRETGKKTGIKAGRWTTYYY